MTAFRLTPPPGGTVLFLGAHADDIEIGAGGTALALFDQRPDLSVVWVVLSGDSTRHTEARTSAAAFCGSDTRIRVETMSFRDGFFPYQGTAVKEAFEQLATTVRPDVVFTHRGADLHQDHRLVSELTWNTFRRAAILEYEVPKYDGDLGQPNVFFPMTEATLARKVDLLLTHFASQRLKLWYSGETFRGLARVRGIEAGVEYAEAFHARKVVGQWAASG